jgi:type II secretory pathway component PulF
MAKNTDSKIRLSSKDRLSLFTGLSTMLTAGIPILEVVESLLSDSKGNPKKVLTRLRASLYNGEPLSKMLGQMPRAFDPVSVNLIRSAEAGGTLETTLRDMVVSTKKEMAFSDQLRITMIYPIFVMFIFFGIIVLMLTFVIPRVASVFSTMNVKIPWVTRLMMKSSVFFLAHWISVALVFAIFVTLVIIFVKSKRRLVVRLILSLPMLRTLGTNIDLARFCRSLGLLMHAGVPIVESLELSERVVHKKEIVAVVQQMKIDVASGKPLAVSMRKPKSIIPPIMSRSIKTAEVSGALDQTLQNLTEYFDEQVSESLKILSSLIEPVLIIMVGAMVGALMISIIAPIYSMISQIGVIPK